VDAWDFIKERIPSASATPPFKFPLWAVAVVSATLLGSMAIVGGPNLIEENENQTERNLSVVAENKEASAYTDDSHSKEQLQSEDEQAIEAEKAIVSNEKTDKSAKDTQRETNDTAPSDVSSVSLLADDVSEPQILDERAQESSKNETTETLENSDDVIEETKVAKEENEQTAVSAKEFAVSGTQECYTPCSLKLRADGNANEYFWDAGIHGVFDGEELTILIEEPTDLAIFSTAKYADGTERTVSHSVEVKAGSQLFVPNSFTPNGDGVNDEYQVSGTGIEEFSMTIVNSKGRVVHQATDLQQSWRLDGVSMDLETEVFTAIVRARGIDGKIYSENVRLIINP